MSTISTCVSALSASGVAWTFGRRQRSATLAAWAGVREAMATTNQFVVYTQVPVEFYRELRRQRWKHVFWFLIDFLLTGVVIVFTPFLAPIPGPAATLLSLRSFYPLYDKPWPD